MQAKRDKRLCYYYNEKYEPMHKCKRRQIYFLEGEEEEETNEESHKIKEEEEKLLVSVHICNTPKYTLIVFKHNWGIL